VKKEVKPEKKVVPEEVKAVVLEKVVPEEVKAVVLEKPKAIVIEEEIEEKPKAIVIEEEIEEKPKAIVIEEEKQDPARKSPKEIKAALGTCPWVYSKGPRQGQVCGSQIYSKQPECGVCHAHFKK
jgi:hypothetical protein